VAENDISSATTRNYPSLHCRGGKRQPHILAQQLQLWPHRQFFQQFSFRCGVYNRSFYFCNGFLSQKRHACGEAHKAFRTLNENSNGSPNGN
jgi:hypothetical protein